MTVAGQHELVKCKPPPGHAPFAEKAKRARSRRMQVPPAWIDTGPDEEAVRQLQMYPVGLRVLDLPDPLVPSPCGAGWHPLVIVKFRWAESTGTDGRPRAVVYVGAWCKEQILKAIDELEGWGLENLLEGSLIAQLFDDNEEGMRVAAKHFPDEGVDLQPGGWQLPGLTWPQPWVDLYHAGWRWYPGAGQRRHSETGEWSANPRLPGYKDDDAHWGCGTLATWAAARRCRGLW